MKKYTTLKDIANKLGVSVTTVSKAISNHPDISDARKKQVLDLVKELNYFPNVIAKNLRKSSTNFIGLIISDSSNPYGIRFIEGVEKVLSESNYNTIIFYSNEDPDKEILIIQELLSINAAGIIVVPTKGHSNKSSYLKNINIPYVNAIRYIKIDEDNYVIPDDIKAGFLATDYLLEKYKSRKVIFINGIDKSISNVRDREKGYKKALEKHNLVFDKSLVYYGIENQQGGYEITKNDILKRFKNPFSIFCYNDFIASGVLKALNDNLIKIPDEVAVMGIDNIELFSFTSPSLSTVNLPLYKLGMQSARLILDLIEKNIQKEQRIVLEPKLIIRETA